MGFLELFQELFILDIKTLMGILVWGNLSLAILSFGYYRFHESDQEQNLINNFGVSKILQALGWFLLFLRGDINDFLSIYLGNLILYISFYLESIIMLNLMRVQERKWYKLQSILLVILVFIFLGYSTLLGSVNIRMAIASFGVFSIFLIPTIFYIANKRSSRFKKYLGSYVLIFLLLLLMRAIESILSKDINLFTRNIFQSGTFITLISLMFVNGAGFLLLMYEHSDEILKVIADLDPLTQISNRRHFMTKADLYYQRHERSQESLSLLFVDIDYFKKVNDTYGHLFGDEVLKILAKVIVDSIRPTDLCCRYGGEEFLILLHETNIEQATLVGTRIREAVEKLEIETKKEFKFTVSIGIFSGVANSHKSIQNFIDNADKGLYMAKESGRNCVISIK